MKTSNRRSFIRRGVTAAAGVTAVAIPTAAAAQSEKPTKKVHYRDGK
jgi:spermidine/putrescine-binding protein